MKEFFGENMGGKCHMLKYTIDYPVNYVFYTKY